MNKQPRKQFDLDQIRRILILRMGPLDETLLTTPVLRALRRRFPEAYIAYMVAPGREELVSENPNLDEVITYSVSIPKLIYGMAKRSFQMVVILQPTFRLVLHTFIAHIPLRIGFETNSGKGRLLHAAVPSSGGAQIIGELQEELEELPIGELGRRIEQTIQKLIGQKQQQNPEDPAKPRD